MAVEQGTTSKYWRAPRCTGRARVRACGASGTWPGTETLRAYGTHNRPVNADAVLNAIPLPGHRCDRDHARRRAAVGLPGEEALPLDLLFRVLAPMRKRTLMDTCAHGIEGRVKEAAACWLGMTLYREYPRRVLMALRFFSHRPSVEIMTIVR